MIIIQPLSVISVLNKAGRERHQTINTIKIQKYGKEQEKTFSDILDEAMKCQDKNK